MNNLNELKSKLHPRRWLNYFLQGLIVVAPIAVTVYLIYSLVQSIDGWIPIFTKTTTDGKTEVRNYGLGFLVIIFGLIIIGILSSFFLRTKLYNLFDNWMEKAPGVKYIYSTTKDFFGAFAGNKKKFNQPVLVCVDADEVWRVGFITESDLTEFGLREHVAVYVPMSYSIAGNVYFVKYSRIQKINNVTAADAMKFAISGGVTEVDDEEETNEKLKTKK
jgi:uncharacterized membrane protein